MAVFPPTSGTGRRLIGASGASTTDYIGATSTTYPAGSMVTEGGSPRTYGSWVQMTASLSSDSIITAVFVLSSAVQGNTLMVFQVGVGGSGSEAAVATASIPAQANPSAVNYFGEVGFPVPPRVAAGSRVSVRLATPSGTGLNATVQLATVAASSLE